jgi:hypothetical protein
METPVRHFTIGKMMAVVLLIASSFAALTNPSPLLASAVFTLTSLTLLIATLCIVYRDRPRRYFWMGFTAFGWGHQVLAFWSMIGTHHPPFLLTTYLFFLSRELVEDGFAAFMRSLVGLASVPSDADGLFLAREHISLSVLSLVIASIAGLVTQHVFIRRDRRQAGAAGSDLPPGQPPS